MWRMASMACGGLLLTVLSPLSYAGTPTQAGLWRFDIRYEIISIPQTFPAYQKTQCLTEANMFPDISRPGQECSSQPRGRFGDLQTWQLDCSSDQEGAQGVGRITFTKNRAKGDVHLQILNPFNPPEFMVFTIEGKRLGECKK